MDAVPTLVIAGTGSGCGKTATTLAILAGLAARGIDVRPFKAGPDYLDPTWHAAAAGRESWNLDAWMTGPEGLLESFRRGTAGMRPGGVAVVEGVMGLFDGADPGGLEGSTAEVARLLRAPVVLVVDARGMARSAAAVVEGFARHAEGVRVRGVIFRGVGGSGHIEILRRAVTGARTPGPVAVLGALPERPELRLAERHLGLVAAGVHPATRDGAARRTWRARLAALAAEHIDLGAIVRLAAEARPRLPAAPGGGRTRPQALVAVARDDAFHFVYPENLARLEEAGAEIAPFSPLADEALPRGAGAVYLVGGYPELHARALSRNRAMHAALRAHAEAGRAIVAECGGMMLLGRALVDAEGRRWPMAGVLPVSTRATARLAALGYREVRARVDTPLGPAGTTWRGHEHHHAVVDGGGAGEALEVLRPPGRPPDGFVAGRALGGWVHAHFGSNPALAAHLVDLAAGGG